MVSKPLEVVGMNSKTRAEIIKLAEEAYKGICAIEVAAQPYLRALACGEAEAPPEWRVERDGKGGLVIHNPLGHRFIVTAYDDEPLYLIDHFTYADAYLLAEAVREWDERER